MSILVTGGCGFIGRNFVEYVLDETEVDKVINIDKLTYCADKKANKSYKKRYQLIEADVNDISSLSLERVNNIIHFAAESHVDNSISGPDPFITSNVNGTYQVVKYASEHNIPVTVVSTDEVYGSLGLEDPSSVETDPLKPSSIYSSSKASADLIALSFYHTWKAPVKITRCCNNYGPHQYKEKFIPVVIDSVKSNKQIPVYGNGKNLREWIHVKDHCSAVWKVATQGKAGEIYNIGTGDCKSNIEIVKSILKVFNKDESLISYVKDRLGHDMRYDLNCQKIITELGWLPKYTDIEDYFQELI